MGRHSEADFAGYRTWRSKRFVRKHSVYTMRQAVKKGRLQSAMAVLGHAKRTHSLRHFIKILKESYHDLQLPKAYQHYAHA
jgi:RNA-directed DNA polymerase